MNVTGGGMPPQEVLNLFEVLSSSGNKNKQF